MKKYILAGLLVCFTINVYSLEVQTSKITYLAPWINHIDVKMNAPHVDAGCGATDFYRIDLANDSGAREKYATLLAAFMADKEVGLSVSQCVGNRGKIQGIRLNKQ